MKIKRRINGEYIELEIVKIKEYSGFALCEICKIENGKRVPIYRECYTDLQLNDISKNRNIIVDNY